VSECYFDEAPENAVGATYCLMHMRPHYFCLESSLAALRAERDGLRGAAQAVLDSTDKDGIVRLPMNGETLQALASALGGSK
jgi:hypothetical protein